MRATRFLVFMSACLTSVSAYAHDPLAQYIANEGVFVTAGETKVLFDPLIVTGFGTYQEADLAVTEAIIKGEGPYAGLDAVFVSHAHDDHFSAPDMIALMLAQTSVRLIAPPQAITQMQDDPAWDADLLSRITQINPAVGDAPISVTLDGIEATAVRIPHSGQRSRATIENMVYRVTVSDKATVMHMGDASLQPDDYTPHSSHWQARETDMGFVPFWFLTSDSGAEILPTLNINKAVGVHVPINTPARLKSSGADYFSTPGETRFILKDHDHE